MDISYDETYLSLAVQKTIDLELAINDLLSALNKINLDGCKLDTADNLYSTTSEIQNAKETELSELYQSLKNINGIENINGIDIISDCYEKIRDYNESSLESNESSNFLESHISKMKTHILNYYLIGEEFIAENMYVDNKLAKDWAMYEDGSIDGTTVIRDYLIAKGNVGMKLISNVMNESWAVDAACTAVGGIDTILSPISKGIKKFAVGETSDLASAYELYHRDCFLLNSIDDRRDEYAVSLIDSVNEDVNYDLSEDDMKSLLKYYLRNEDVEISSSLVDSLEDYFNELKEKDPYIEECEEAISILEKTKSTELTPDERRANLMNLYRLFRQAKVDENDFYDTSLGMFVKNNSLVDYETDEKKEFKKNIENFTEKTGVISATVLAGFGKGFYEEFIPFFTLIEEKNGIEPGAPKYEDGYYSCYELGEELFNFISLGGHALGYATGILADVGLAVALPSSLGVKAADTAVDATKAADIAVDAAKAVDNAVDAAKAVDNAVDAAKAVDNAVDAAKAVDNAADAAKAVDNVDNLEELIKGAQDFVLKEDKSNIFEWYNKGYYKVGNIDINTGKKTIYSAEEIAKLNAKAVDNAADAAKAVDNVDNLEELIKGAKDYLLKKINNLMKK